MQISGHRGIRERLQTGVERGTFPQACLFVGPESIGKRLVALECAGALLGENTTDRAQQGDVQTHPDIMLVEPERVTEKGKTREKRISVEMVRESIHFLSRYPLLGKKRIVIIDNAHQLSHGAQNALLKTLEEPNDTSVLILVTHHASALLDTIHSRVQTFRFGYVSAHEMRISGLEGASDAALLRLGRPGIVVTAARDAASFADTRALLERLFNLAQYSVSEKLLLAEDMAKDSMRAVRLLTWLAPSVRHEALVLQEYKEIERMYRFLSALIHTEQLIRETQVNTRLQLEKLLLSV